MCSVLLRWPRSISAPACSSAAGTTGAAVFIWVWLAAALVNGAVGVLRAGIPVLNEIGAFIPIFGIPAVAAWYLAYKYAPGR